MNVNIIYFDLSGSYTNLKNKNLAGVDVYYKSVADFILTLTLVRKNYVINLNLKL